MNPDSLGEDDNEDDEEGDEEEEFDTNDDIEDVDDSDQDDLDEQIRAVRASNRQLEEQIANQDKRLSAAASMQEQFTKAVDAIRKHMVILKGAIATGQQWEGFGNIGGVHSNVASDEAAATRTALISGAALAANDEDFLAIENHMLRARKLIAIRDNIERGESFYFDANAIEEIQQLAKKEATTTASAIFTDGGVGAPPTNQEL